MNESCVFVGPTRVPKKAYPQIDFFPPAALGSVFRAFEQGYRRIGIIDGFFGNTPSVWHKEIMFVIAKGAEVVGAASTGALRAAELAPYGMRGIGNIYRLYRRASIADDDEVCVTHAIEELDFMPLSEPMISIRYTLRDLRHAGIIPAWKRRRSPPISRPSHFSERTLERIRAAIAPPMSRRRAPTIGLRQLQGVPARREGRRRQAPAGMAERAAPANRRPAGAFPAPCIGCTSSRTGWATCRASARSRSNPARSSAPLPQWRAHREVHYPIAPAERPAGLRRLPWGT